MDLTLRPFRPGDEAAFREINEAWIRQYFSLEAKDQAILNDPRCHILDPGGAILLAELDGRPVGCCALIPAGEGAFELAKMGVVEDVRGAGVGRKLLAYAIEQARGSGAVRLRIETNSKLANAVHLYEAAGFQHRPTHWLGNSPYTRCNVVMELILSPGEAPA